MAEVLENSKYNGSEASASTHSLSFGFTATAGRLLILGLSAPGGAVTINSIDSGWVEIGNGASGTRTFTPYWYYKIATGGETGVSVTYSAAQAINWAVEEWSGLAASSVLDQAAENETYLNTTTTSLSSGTTATLSISDGFAISFLACDVSSGWNEGTTVSDGYATTGYNAQPGPGCGFAYKKLSGTSGASTTWSTTDAGEQTYAAIAVFKPAAGGGAAILPSLYTDADTFHAATVTPGAVSLAPSLYADADTFHAATVSQGGALQTLTPSLYTDADTFHAAEVAASYNLQPAAYADDDAFHAATVAASYGIAPSLYADADTFHAPTVSIDGGPQYLVPDLFADGDTFHAAAVSPGAVSLTPALYVDADTFPAATVAATYGIAPALYADADSFHAATVTQGGAVLQPALYVDADTFYAAVISGGLALAPLGAARAGARDLSTGRRVNLSTSRRR